MTLLEDCFDELCWMRYPPMVPKISKLVRLIVNESALVVLIPSRD